MTSGSGIEALFGRIAPRYDLLNRLFSFRRDVFWREAAARLLKPGVDGPILDLACGTLDLTLEIARTYPERMAVGADFSLEMMRLGRPKLGRHGPDRLSLVGADGLNLPFPDQLFAGASIAFGIRNIPNHIRALKEFFRVIKPGGRLVVLELGIPAEPLAKIYTPYLKHVMPFISRLLSPDADAYTYLVKSIINFPGPAEFTGLMEEAGFKAHNLALNSGICRLFIGDRQA